MKISRIDHLGIGVESIDAVLPYFENVLGLKCYAIEEVADQKVKTAFLKVGEVKLELLNQLLQSGWKRVARVFTTWLSLLKTVWLRLLLRLKARRSV